MNYARVIFVCVLSVPALCGCAEPVSDNKKLRYRYKIRFVLEHGDEIQLELYSDYKYEGSMHEVLHGNIIGKSKNIYKIENQGRCYMFHEADVRLIEISRDKNPDYEKQKTALGHIKDLWNRKRM